MILLILHPGDRRDPCASPPVGELGTEGSRPPPNSDAPTFTAARRREHGHIPVCFRTPIVQLKQWLPLLVKCFSLLGTATTSLRRLYSIFRGASTHPSGGRAASSQSNAMAFSFIFVRLLPLLPAARPYVSSADGH
jgi:hypothetical protein